jgi:hypothetical protein
MNILEPRRPKFLAEAATESAVAEEKTLARAR